jgi:hypothetical protein
MKTLFKNPIKGTFVASLVSVFLLAFAFKSSIRRDYDGTVFQKYILPYLSRAGLVEDVIAPILIAGLTSLLVVFFKKFQFHLNQNQVRRNVAQFFLVGGYLGLAVNVVMICLLFSY